jgi:hypothetical protein
MKQWVVASVCLGMIAVIFMGAGLMLGERRVATIPQTRFIRVSDTISFDTKTGQNCDTDAAISDGSGGPSDLPKGFRLNTGRPLCSELDKKQ